MPRNTRPPTNLQNRTKPLKSALRRTQPRPVVHVGKDEHHHPASESEAELELDGSEYVSDKKAGDAQDDEDEDDDDADADAPRVVQWADEQDEDSEELLEEETDDENTEDIPAKPSRELVRSHLLASGADMHTNLPVLRSSGLSRAVRTSLISHIYIYTRPPGTDSCHLSLDLSSLPLGMLRKAQRTLSQARALTDSESDSESDAPSEDAYATDDDERPRSTTATGKEKENPRTRKDLAKRSSKHAPTEITSKRPVTRRRTVVESTAPQPRDPRFLNITGSYDPQKFKQQYTFLSTLHTDELKTLRSNLSVARKLLLNSPKDLRAAREREVGRLELAVKRGESSVNRDKREKVEMEALERVGREEREKRKRGKAGWWMKSSEKKELLIKARYDDIASSGGKRAVKKAIEKKQKKQSQKEKRSRPFPAPGRANTSFGSASGQKRPARFTLDEERSSPSKKRRKF